MHLLNIVSAVFIVAYQEQQEAVTCRVACSAVCNFCCCTVVTAGMGEVTEACCSATLVICCEQVVIPLGAMTWPSRFNSPASIEAREKKRLQKSR